MSLFRRSAAPELRSYTGPEFNLGDPALAQFLGLSSQTLAGVSVNETSSLGLTAVYRAVSIISETIAGLPLKSYRTAKDGTRARVATFLDNPHPDMTSHELWSLVMVHLLLHGNAYLLHIYNGAEAIAGLQPIHPSLVSVEATADGKLFTVSMADGSQREYTSADLTHVPALSTDGLLGLSPIQACRQALGTNLASDQAAARQFGNGFLIGGTLSIPGATPEQVDAALASLRAKAQGAKNAGDIVGLNADATFSPWTMSADDAQFIEQRQFGINEVARLYGVPKVLLAEDGASTWGTGIAELNKWFKGTALMGWTSRLEQRLSRLLSRPTTCEFDYAGMFQSSPADEIDLLIKQLDAGILTLDEVRRIRNLPPLPAAQAPEGDNPA